MGKIKKWTIGVLVGLALLVTTAFQSDFFEIAKQIDIYTTLFKELNMYYIDEVNPAKLSNKAISSMLESLDPYTRYMMNRALKMHELPPPVNMVELAW